MPYVIERYYEVPGGLGLRQSDLTRPNTKASAMLNALKLRTGTWTGRQGYKVRAGANGGLGLIKYGRVSSTTGATTIEVLTCGAKLYKVVDSLITLTYTDTTTSYDTIVVTNLVVAGSWHFIIEADGTEILDLDLGDGITEASPVTLADLKTAVDALDDLALTITGTTTTPAAFLVSTNVVPVEINAGSGTLTIAFSYEQAVPQPGAGTTHDPFPGSVTNRNADTFENVSFTNLNNVVYLANGYNELKKYDGQKVYRAGIPKGNTPTATPATGPGRTLTNITYRLTFIQYDAQGFVTEGVISEASNEIDLANETASIAFTPLAASTGFNTDAAMVVGNQTGTTIAVDNGSGGVHTLKVGDTAYLASSGVFTTRTVTAVSGSTVTFNSSVTVLDNAPISANLRVGLYVQQVEDGDYYLVAEYPHNSFVGTQTIIDAGGALGAQFISPLQVETPELPPKGNYVSSWRGQLVISGSLEFPNRVFFSGITSPEYFPAATNAFDVQTLSAGAITGIWPVNEFLYIFKEDSTHLVTGELLDFTFRVDLISAQVGCVSFHSIDEIEGVVIFNTKVGPFQTSRGSIPVSISEDILPVFTSSPVTPEATLKLKRSIGIYDTFFEKYILFLPAESINGVDVYANNYSRVFAFDKFESQWLEWDNMNMEGGAIIVDDELIWQERRLQLEPSTAIAVYIYNRMQTGSDTDLVDHTEAIPFMWQSAWKSQEDPSRFKKFLTFKTYSTDPVYNSSFVLTVKQEINYIAGVFHSQFDLVFGGADGDGFSYGGWGSSAWGDPTVTAQIGKCKPNKAISARWTFLHEEIYTRPLISGYEYEVAIPYRPKVEK